MSKTSNEIMEADQRLTATLNELIEIRAEARAREIVGEFTVESFPIKFDIEKIDFDNRIIEISGGAVLRTGLFGLMGC